jgi:hypothetical protein
VTVKEKPYSKTAIYKGHDGVACIVTTTIKAVSEYGEDNVFAAAVPEGVEYEIIDLSDIDAMYEIGGSFRDAWEVDVKASSGKGSCYGTPREVRDA